MRPVSQDTLANGLDVIAAQAKGRIGLWVYATTLLVSAALLFSVQPLFAKMILPKLGGSPSVWAVAMCFFQAALLAGYCYAHALNRWAPVRYAGAIHLVLCLAAAAALPFALPAWAEAPPEGDAYLWLVGVLAVGVGLPFFAVSANAPLLQAWFARSGHPHAHDPYFLYGASNLGSLTALLSYPVLIEPLLGVADQRLAWAAGFGVLTVLLALCSMLVIASQSRQSWIGAPTSIGLPVEARRARVTMAERSAWVGLAFIPSALLVAFTTHITTDIASAPFLWVIPLATFLGTFVIVFRDTPLIPHRFVLLAHPVLVALSLLLVVVPSIAGELGAAAIGFATFVITTLVCHRVLYEARPSSEKLTEFYLFMSLGGVLGGVFAALIAPQLFSTVLEYPLLVLAGLAARPDLLRGLKSSDERETAGMIGLAIAVPMLAVAAVAAFGVELGVITQVLAVTTLFVAAVALVILRNRGVSQMAVGVAAAIVVILSQSHLSPYIAERSFFGVSKIGVSPSGEHRIYMHGSTVHGAERLKDAAGNRGPFPPTMYYHPGAPMARGVDVARRAIAGRAEPLSIGIIGLGTGSLACYRQPNEAMTFYEIDPVVDRIARNPDYFTFVTRCAPNAPTRLGDARVVLETSDARYDYLVVDAFSSDAVPVHLLTREALLLYANRISERGLIALHISNRHMDLESVVAATARTIPGLHAVLALDPDGLAGYDGSSSRVAFLSWDESIIAEIAAWPHSEPANSHGVAAWTDDYADVVSAIWRNYAR